MKKIDLLKNFRRKAPAEVALHCVVSAIFMLVALSYIYIVVWMVIAACKTHTEIILNPFSLPEVWNWSHFLEVPSLLEVNGNGFFDMLFNSIWFSVIGVLFQQAVCMVFAYTCTKYTFPGSKFVYTLILIVMTLPLYGTSGAMYTLYHNLGLVDSYAQIIASGAVTNKWTLYYIAFFKNLSWTYAEAAQVDGANHFQICYKVMLPQTKPIFGALFLTEWIQIWNNYESALIYLPSLPTLPVGIYQFNTEMIYRARLDILFAACIIVLLPALILFIVFNKTITTSVSAGGIKG